MMPTVEDTGLTLDDLRPRGYPNTAVEALRHVTKHPEETVDATQAGRDGARPPSLGSTS